MSQSRSLEVLVGLFVCLGVAAVFIMTLRISNLASEGPESGYTVTANFENIGGLKVGSKVTMAGVRVGRVTGITFDREYFEALVTMDIGNEYDMIPVDTSASILTAGLLGEQYIGLTPGGAEEVFKGGDHFKFTQSALVLEQIVGQFLYGQADKGKD